jgi:hypothetical protein
VFVAAAVAWCACCSLLPSFSSIAVAPRLSPPVLLHRRRNPTTYTLAPRVICDSVWCFFRCWRSLIRIMVDAVHVREGPPPRRSDSTPPHHARGTSLFVRVLRKTASLNARFKTTSVALVSPIAHGVVDAGRASSSSPPCRSLPLPPHARTRWTTIELVPHCRRGEQGLCAPQRK